MTIDWVDGDHLRLPIPVHPGAFRAGGAEFLTRALHRSGALPLSNAVRRITAFEEFRGGSTGRKATLSVEYDAPTGLPADLFVKFSRDLEDAVRDRGRTQMAAEIRFALLSRTRDFPVAVPRCLFADHHGESGTGILITERITFGANGIEPHYRKCLDYLVPDPLEHYEAVLTSIATLAGTDRAGGLPEADFPVDIRGLSMGQRAPYGPDQLSRRVERFAEFAAAHPALLPADVRAPEFHTALAHQVVAFPRYEQAIWGHLAAAEDYIALCHWNGNIDNAWFRRDEHGRLRCGLLDWGSVGRMHIAMAIWGALSGAETELWDRHLDRLLDGFVAAFTRAGGTGVTVEALTRDTMLYAAVMGVNWLLDVPGHLQRTLPADVHDRFDPRVSGDESVRTRLQMTVNFLNLWQTRDFGELLATHLGDSVS